MVKLDAESISKQIAEMIDAEDLLPTGALNHRPPKIEELIARSSLGTPEAVAIRKQAPRDIVEAVIKRVSNDEERRKRRS